jgi:hypothetical protein
MRVLAIQAVISTVLATPFCWVLDATACTCSGTPTVDEERAGAACVFSCRVVAKEEAEPRYVTGANTKKYVSSADMTRYVVVPLDIWKGAAADTLVVYSARLSVSCGYEMTIGGEYLLYAVLWDPTTKTNSDREWAQGKPAKPVLVVGLCSRNRPLTAAVQDIKELGESIWRRE